MTVQAGKSKPNTLNDIFNAAVEREHERVMLFEERGEWKSISSRELYRRVTGVARELRAWGIQRGDRVAILSENRPEWTIADFAILMIGAVTVPIYASLTSEQCEFVLQHSEARAIFVSSQAQLKKVRRIRATTGLEHIAMMDALPDPPEDVAWIGDMFIAGTVNRDPALDGLASAVTPDDIATLIYTSGTTGVPKGVVLTHGNLTSNIEVSLDTFDIDQDAVSISYLPLAHITARHVDFALIYRGCTLAYCPVIDDLTRVMLAIRPTFFVAVPRVYEKIYNQTCRLTARGIKHSVFNWAIGVGAAHVNEVLAGKRPTSAAWRLADKLVFSHIREGMGGRIKIFISGGAPLGRELAEWYAKVGLQVNEGYGLTETSPVVALNHPGAYKLGTVGRPVPNIEVKIADDGEILVRGPSVFKGYWRMPEETANAFQGDWFKTGDLGGLDVDGFLSITDRKKDLIKTSGGKFIAPQPIENSLKANPLVAEAAVVGDRRRFAAVMIAPAFAQLEDWARHNEVPFTNRMELVSHPRIQALYQGIVAEVNRNLARFETMKKVLILPEELSVAEGTLTPTLKLRRRILEARYKEDIERLYSEPESVAADPALAK
jgi:long-chain acyl-CoA synthetase